MFTPAPSTRSRTRLALLLACAGGAISSVSIAERGVILRSTSWTDPVSGNWFDPARWSTGVPQNTDTEVFHANIAAAGSPYTVSANADVTIRQLNLISGDATLLLTGAATFRTDWANIGDQGAPGLSRLQLHNATIDGGTWNIESGEFRVTGFGFNAIRNATILGDVLVNSGTSVRIDNSQFERVRLLGSASGISATGDLNITGEVAFEGSGTGSRNLRTDSAIGRITIQQGARLTTADEFEGNISLGVAAYTPNQTVANHGSVEVHSGAMTIYGASVTNNNSIDARDSTLTIVSDAFSNVGLLTLSNADFVRQAGVTLNAGTIAANASSLDLTSGLVNAGTLSSTNSTVAIDGSNFSNTGTLSLISSTLRVNNEFTLAGLGNVQRTASTIEVLGVLNNAGQTIDLDAAGDIIRLDGGTIRGGSIVGTSAASLTFSNSVDNTLDNVHVDGRLELMERDSFLRLANGSTLRGHVYLGGQFAELRFEGSTTLTDTVIEGSGADGGITSSVAGATLTIDESSSIIGRDISMNSYAAGGDWHPFANIINRGLISSEGRFEESGFYTNIERVNFLNEGQIVVQNEGGLILPQDFDNTNGSLTITNNSWVQFIGGRLGTPVYSFDVLSGSIQNAGRIEFSGRLDLQGEHFTFTQGMGTVFIGSQNAPVSADPNFVENGSITVQSGATFGVQRQLAIFNNLDINGTLQLFQGGRASFAFSTIDGLSMERNATATFDEASVVSGPIVMRDESVLTAPSFDGFGPISIARGQGNEIRLTNPTDGVLDGDSPITMAPSTRVLVLGAPTSGPPSTLTNRRDWDLSPTSLATLRAAIVRNETDLALAGSLTLEGSQRVENTGDVEITAGTFTMLSTAGAVANAGTITTAPGATVRISGLTPFENTGQVIAAGGTVAFAGNETIDSFDPSRVMTANGFVRIEGSADLLGSTLSLDDDRGQWSVNSGRVHNGSIEIADGSSLILASTQQGARNHLENVSVTGLLIGDTNFRIGDNVAFERLAIDGAFGTFDTAQVLGDVSLERGASTVLFSSAGAGAQATIEQSAGIAARRVELGDPTPVLTLDLAGRELVNRGDIEADRGRVEVVNAPRVVNEGAITVDTMSRITINEDFAQSASGSLFISVAEGASNSRFQVNASATLAGSLTLDARDPSFLSIGSLVPVFRAESGIVGWFDSIFIEQPGSESDIRVALRVNQLGDADILSALVRHVADVSGDGVVDFTDLNTVTSEFGLSGSLLAGDANTDGVVDFLDLNLVLSNFGNTFPRAVPTTPTSVAVGLAALAMIRRRRSA